jgi:hypothetical protein
VRARRLLQQVAPHEEEEEERQPAEDQRVLLVACRGRVDANASMGSGVWCDDNHSRHSKAIQRLPFL